MSSSHLPTIRWLSPVDGRIYPPSPTNPAVGGFDRVNNHRGNKSRNDKTVPRWISIPIHPSTFQPASSISRISILLRFRSHNPFWQRPEAKKYIPFSAKRHCRLLLEFDTTRNLWIEDESVFECLLKGKLSRIQYSKTIFWQMCTLYLHTNVIEKIHAGDVS